MPLINEAYWRLRFGQASPCWSGDRWLDWEHGVVARHAVRRVWPADLRGQTIALLDIGCGDGRFTAWMSREFKVQYRGLDALEFPGHVLGSALIVGDAEQLSRLPEIGTPHQSYGRYLPDIVCFVNSLTCMQDWREAVSEAMKVADRVLVFDNLQTPTPAYWRNLPHRKAVRVDELLAAFDGEGFAVERAVAADWFHRKLFVRTPRWLHAAVAMLTCGLDLAAAHVLPVRRGRHMAILFRRRPA